MDTVTLRIAGAADAELIADISRETFADTFAAHNTAEDMELFLSQQFSREMLAAEVGERGNTFFLAEQAGSVIGYMFLADHTAHPQFGNALEISRLYVRRPYIGTGAGRKLMLAAFGEARSRNKPCLFLGVWEHNTRAIAFYQKFGFVKAGEHDFILGKDVQNDWLMKCTL